MNMQRKLQVFEVILKDQPSWKVMARDSESAAFQALELANAHNTELIDVRYYEEW
jgi:hypothetical protein